MPKRPTKAPVMAPMATANADAVESLIDLAKGEQEQAAAPPAVIEVDITPYLPGRDTAKPAVILKWRKPTVVEHYRVASDAAKLKLGNGHWSDQLAQHVAAMAAAHCGQSIPLGNSKAAFVYAAWANSKNSELWEYLVRRLGDAFPTLAGVPAERIIILDLCVRYLSRHPEELKDVDAGILAELQELKKARDADRLTD